MGILPTITLFIIYLSKFSEAASIYYIHQMNHMVHSIIIPLPLEAHISIKQSIYSENIIINYMTIMIKNYAARLDIVKISVFLVSLLNSIRFV